MALARRFNNQQPDLANIFEDFFGGGMLDRMNSLTSGANVPSVNIKDNKGDYTITVRAETIADDGEAGDRGIVAGEGKAMFE